MKRLIGSGASALVLLGAGLGVVAAPASAEDPDGSKVAGVVLYGSDGRDDEPTRFVVMDDIDIAQYSQYDPLPSGRGAVEAGVPADPAWFDQGQGIEFGTPNCCGDQSGTVRLEFGDAWKQSGDDGTNRYVSLNNNSGARTWTLNGSGTDTGVWARKCDGSTWAGDPLSCSNPLAEVQIVLSSSPSPDPDPGNGGGSSSSGSGSSAPMLNLTLDPTQTDATCSVAGVSGVRGSWVTLEAASDCTPPPSTPGATLLGWATDPDFPVDIAQRQVDNGWGAYETYNDDGQLTGVFIPAGGAASLTNSNTLHAIWSDTTTGS